MDIGGKEADGGQDALIKRGLWVGQVITCLNLYESKKRLARNAYNMISGYFPDIKKTSLPDVRRGTSQ